MAHPTHAWMSFNWYTDDWWFDSNCTKNDTERQAIEDILLTSLIFDHYPRIDENDKDKRNVGNIVSCNTFAHGEYLYQNMLCILYYKKYCYYVILFRLGMILYHIMNQLLQS